MHQVPPLPPGMAYWPGYGYFPVPPQGMGYPPPGAMPGEGAMHGHGAGMSQVMDEIANGGSGLTSLTRMLDLDDKDFWKGALVGAAAVLLLTNDSVQKALFRGAVKGRDAVEEGVEKVKTGVRRTKDKVRAARETSDE
ncbi:YtxH domain-containing protein [Parasulfuritortus cantonensis]|nr:YtxH domain-containing protein [Parasulfuritortus cantonensis]